MTSGTLLVVCSLLFAWKLTDLVRDVRDTAAWSVSLACGSMAAFVLLGEPAVIRWTDESVAPDTAALLRNLALVACFASLQFVYFCHIAVFRSGRRRLGEAAVVLVVAVVATTAAMLVPSSRSLAPSPENLSSPAVATFYVAITLYTCHACATQVYWTVRFHRRLRQTTLRVATLLIGTGAAMLLALQVSKLASWGLFSAGALDAVPEHGFWGTLLLRVGISTLLVGLLLPIIVEDGGSVVAAVCTAVDFHRLAALDRAVVAAFPELVRPASPGTGGRSSTRSFPHPFRVGFAYQERLQRCRDGYTRALPLIAAGADPDDDALRRLLEALERFSAPLPTPRAAGERDHVLAVSDAMRRQRGVPGADGGRDGSPYARS